MASRVELFTITTPAGTLASAPLVTDCRFDIGEVEGIEVLIPPGPSGLIGFGIMHSNASVFPREENKWLIADNEVIKWVVENVPTAGRWAIRSYNTDVNPHSIYVRFLVREVSGTTPLAIPAITINQPNQPATVPE